MLIDAPLTYVLGPIILCWLMAYIVKWRGQTQESDPIKRAWTNFKLNTIGSGIVLVILWLALPSTSSLSTFKGLDDLRDPQLLAKYLHDYSRAVVRTTEVVGWLLFLLVWWFGSALYDFLKILAKSPAANPAGSPSGL